MVKINQMHSQWRSGVKAPTTLKCSTISPPSWESVQLLAAYYGCVPRTSPKETKILQSPKVIAWPGYFQKWIERHGPYVPTGRYAVFRQVYSDTDTRREGFYWHKDAFQKILQQEGVLALWNGTFPSLLLVFNPAIQFMFYEGLKRQLLRRQTEISSLEVFVIGAIAKAIATTVTYPLQTVQSVLRFGHEKLNPEKRTLGSLRSVIYLLKQRVRRLGFLGLYKGLEAKLLQTVLTAALMFLVYEKLVSLTLGLWGLKPKEKS